MSSMKKLKMKKSNFRIFYRFDVQFTQYVDISLGKAQTNFQFNSTTQAQVLGPQIFKLNFNFFPRTKLFVLVCGMLSSDKTIIKLFVKKACA